MRRLGSHESRDFLEEPAVVSESEFLRRREPLKIGNGPDFWSEYGLRLSGDGMEPSSVACVAIVGGESKTRSELLRPFHARSSFASSLCFYARYSF